MKNSLGLLVLSLLALPPILPAETIRRPAITPADEAKVDAIIAKLSVEEKVRQLCAVYPGEGAEILTDYGTLSREKMLAAFGEDGAGAVSTPLGALSARKGAEGALMIQDIATKHTRAGIPTLIHSEALHGLCNPDSACFPQAIGIGATWDIPLMEKIADRIGREARARGTRQLLSPVLDLARDPRHGRFEECYSEDPLLASRMGVAYVRGVQAHGVICTPKHFVANFVAPGGRDSGDIEISDREMRELYFAPYEAAVRDGGALGIMSAYNSVNGIPCSANKHLLQDVLRDEWGFKGIVVSDWSAVNHTHDNLRAAPDNMAGARACLAAGLDVDLPRLKFYAQLSKEVEEGRVTMKMLDAAVRRELLTKAAIGLFDSDEKFADPDEAEKLAGDKERRELPLAAARESIVLLKNKDHTLPIADAVKRIAVIGPNADVLRLGGYTANGVTGPTPLEAIQTRFGKTAEILHAEGCSLTGKESRKEGDQRLADAVETAKQADLCVLVMGGNYRETGGESIDRSTLGLQGRQEELIRAVAATGNPVVVVLVNGYAVTVKNWIDQVDALLCCWYGGSEGNTALAEILAGDVNPSGHLPVTFPRTLGQIPMTYDMRPNGRFGQYVPLNPGEWKSELKGNRYDPQFPFGFGLSYASFKFSDIELSPSKVATDGKTTVSVKVTNTGDRAGETVVQLYLAADWQRIVPRDRRLRDFTRVALNPGESRVVSFELGPKDFSFLDENLRPEVEPGTFTVSVGEDCLAPLSAKVTVL